jgi:hypothetical protein
MKKVGDRYNSTKIGLKIHYWLIHIRALDQWNLWSQVRFELLSAKTGQGVE